MLTTLLSDALGGNCLTSCIVTFKPIKTPASAIVLRYGLRLKKIINYPTQNTSNFKVCIIICYNYYQNVFGKVHIFLVNDVNTISAHALSRWSQWKERLFLKQQTEAPFSAGVVRYTLEALMWKGLTSSQSLLYVTL